MTDEKRNSDLNLAERAALKVGKGILKGAVKVGAATGRFGARVVKEVVHDAVGKKKENAAKKVDGVKENISDKMGNVGRSMKAMKETVKDMGKSSPEEE